MIDTSSASSVDDAIAEYEPGVAAAVRLAMQRLLEAARRAVMAGSGVPDLDAWPSPDVWVRAVRYHIVGAVEKIFAAFGDVDIRQYTQQYLEDVESRLKDFDAQVFEEVRYELHEGIESGDSTRELRQRIGWTLRLDAPSRAIQADIAELTRQIANETDATRRQQLRDERRSLYRDADDADRRWMYRADRIARTETTGAVNAGVYADGIARANSGESGLSKQWWATTDTRTRPSHWVAHGQVVAMGDSFRVGGHDMEFPGDPRGPAHEVINCRCALLILGSREADRERAKYDADRPTRSDAEGSPLDDDGNKIVT